jgi:DNA-binding beta-propeller fold protein YncE
MEDAMSVKKLAVFGLICAVAGLGVGGAWASRDAMYEGASRIAGAAGDARAQSTNAGDVVVTNSSGQTVAVLSSDSVGDGIGGIANRIAKDRVVFDVTASDAGRLYVVNASNRPTFVMDAALGVGAASGDVAEMFPASAALDPGSVVVIDAQHRGAMSLATSAYDRRVAGVVAGANDYRSAITLRAMDGTLGKVPVTLTGTAYCLATNANGAIKAGDLLTTSAVPGHAMRVIDHDAARGAILGKALEDLKGDKGQILILASLQ